MVFLSKLKHDQGRESAQQNWGILFPLILLITHEIFTVILLEFPTFLVYLTKVSPFFEERLTKISPKYILRVGNELVITIVNISIIIIIRYILRIRYDTSFNQMGLSFCNFRKYLFYGGTIGIIKSTVIIIPILMIWPEYTESYKRIDILQGASVLQGVSLFFGYFLGMIIAGPLCEEILFRGLFFSALRKYVNLFWAILISACLFSFTHGFFPVMISAFLSAILLCFLYEKTRSLMLCITIHAVGNVFNNLYFILFSFII
ncbi:MAG: CPBP family intramembrane metalloprotease [Gemmatimonadetes bacterium]|nr:CPBP family intramembrane metalloprotease [Gemmatimonadota bacterium]